MAAITETPMLRRHVPPSPRVVVVGIALMAALTGGFALGRTTVPDARDDVDPQVIVEEGRTVAGPVTVPDHHPRVKWGHAERGSHEDAGEHP
jgi:hypothetical protein